MKHTTILLLLFISCSCFAKKIGPERGTRALDGWNTFHPGIGIATDFFPNSMLCPFATVLIGPHYFPFNATASVGIGAYNPFYFGKGDYINAVVFPFSVGLRYNIPVFHLYVEADATYLIFQAFEGYYYSSGKELLKSENLIRNSISTVLKIGRQWDKTSVALIGRYYITPPINQKYIFETPGFNYDAASASINARFSVGISLIYYFL